MKNSFKLIPLIFFSFLFSQISSGQIPLDFKEFNIKYKPKGNDDSTNLIIKSGQYSGYKLNIVLQDIRGKSVFKLLNKKSEIVITGSFENSRDTLSQYMFIHRRGERLDKPVLDILLEKYFLPIPSGEWIYYKNGHEIKRKFISHEFLN